MNASRPALPEPTLAAWSRTARPVRLPSSIVRPGHTGVDVPTPDVDATDRVDDLMFGCSAAALMAMPWLLVAAALAA